MSSLFDIGVSGLRASKYAMYLTANNIANANNPFFVRRQIDFLERKPGLLGNGVDVGDIRRITNALSEQQLLSATHAWASASAFFDNIKNFETSLDNDETSISKFIDASVAALESLNANSTSVQGKNFYLDQLKNLSNRITDVSARIDQERLQSKKNLSEQLRETNQLLQQLFEINEKIKTVTGSDKLGFQDTQDKLLNDLAQRIDFRRQFDENGALQIQLDNGLPLIQGNYVASLVLSENTNPESLYDIGISHANSTVSITSFLHGGKIAGLLDYTNGKLNLMQHKLDKLAISMAYTMNQQNKLGINAQGTLGCSLFNDPNSVENIQNKVVASTLNQGAGNFSVQINQPDLLTDSDYQLSFDSPTHYRLIRMSDGNTVNEGMITNLPLNIKVDGFSMDLASGTWYAGDTYFINPTKNGADQLKVIAQNGGALALGFPVTSTPSTENKGSGQIDVSAILDTSTSAFSIPNQLNPPLKIDFLNATTYRLVNANDNSVIEDNISYDPAQPQSVFPTPANYDPGYRITLSGSIRAGDSFSITYNTNGSGDNRNGLAMEGLYKKGLVGSDKLTFTQSYQDLVFELASTTNSAKINLDASTLLKNQAQIARDEISGVSLEEETMNLTRLQESYLANAQILEAVKQTMDVLFAVFRR